MPALWAWCSAGASFSTIMPSLRDFRFADRSPHSPPLVRSFAPSLHRSVVLSCPQSPRRKPCVSTDVPVATSLATTYSISPFPVFGPIDLFPAKRRDTPGMLLLNSHFTIFPSSHFPYLIFRFIVPSAVFAVVPSRCRSFVPSRYRVVALSFPRTHHYLFFLKSRLSPFLFLPSPSSS